MTTELVRLSYEIASGANVSYVDDTSINPSEGGVSGRIEQHGVQREYMLSVSPKQSREMVHTTMVLRRRRPLALRDYADNYILEDEEIPHTGTTALIGRTWAPSTGSYSEFERILYIDQEETPFVVKVNGGIPSPASWTLEDFGKIEIPGLDDEDVVTVSGHYMIVVCFVDSPSTSIITNGNGETIHRFSDMRFRQVFEAELEKLVPPA